MGVRVDKIITLADKSAELQIRVFVRSLRKVGCDLPVWVIPFWERDFELPSTCRWIEDSKVLRFLRQNAAHPLYNKYSAQLFTSYLTVAERREWDANIKRKRDALRWLERWPWPIRALNRFVRLIDPRFHVQPRF